MVDHGIIFPGGKSRFSQGASVMVVDKYCFLLTEVSAGGFWRGSEQAVKFLYPFSYPL